MKISSRTTIGLAIVSACLIANVALAQQKPNILVIWGDDSQTDGNGRRRFC